MSDFSAKVRLDDDGSSLARAWAEVGDFRGPKTAILTHLEAQVFDFDEFLLFLKA